MKQIKWLVCCLVLIVVKPTAAQQNIDSLIRYKDSLFWKAYNNCDLAGMQRFLTTDLEFYHDKGGITKGAENLMATTKKGLCGTPGYHLRREAIAGTVKVFPMQANGQVYGALISGEHLFYITDKGQPEYRDGHALFTQLWVLQDGEWKMSRILSYDHKPAAYQNKRQPMVLPASALNRLAGKYQSKDKGAFAIRVQGGNLALAMGNRVFTLYPESAQNFFVQDRDLIFIFAPEGKLEIKENGTLVDKAVRVR